MSGQLSECPFRGESRRGSLPGDEALAICREGGRSRGRGRGRRGEGEARERDGGGVASTIGSVVCRRGAASRGRDFESGEKLLFTRALPNPSPYPHGSAMTNGVVFWHLFRDWGFWLVLEHFTVESQMVRRFSLSGDSCTVRYPISSV